MDKEDEEEHLTFEDPWSYFNTTTGGHSPVCSIPREPGLLRETVVEVHAQESEVEEL